MEWHSLCPALIPPCGGSNPPAPASKKPCAAMFRRNEFGRPGSVRDIPHHRTAPVMVGVAVIGSTDSVLMVISCLIKS